MDELVDRSLVTQEVPLRIQSSETYDIDHLLSIQLMKIKKKEAGSGPLEKAIN